MTESIRLDIQWASGSTWTGNIDAVEKLEILSAMATYRPFYIKRDNVEIWFPFHQIENIQFTA
jgi:hypothetical protein